MVKGATTSDPSGAMQGAHTPMTGSVSAVNTMTVSSITSGSNACGLAAAPPGKDGTPIAVPPPPHRSRAAACMASTAARS
jgi:hypothetical protein